MELHNGIWEGDAQTAWRGEFSPLGWEIVAAPLGESLERLIEEIYRRDTKALKYYVKRIVRNDNDAEDIVQDSFLRLWRALASGMVNSPRAVLFKTARNLSLNHIRNDRVRSAEMTRVALDEAMASSPRTAEEERIASEQAAEYQSVLDRLPQRYREVFSLRVLEELSYKEISERLNLSVSTIEKQIGRSKEICRSRLEKTRPREGES